MVVKDIDGNATGTVTVTNTMTFNDLFAALVPLGVDGDIQDGRVTMLHNNGGYVDGSFAAAMGIGTTYKTVTTTTTVGGTQTTASKTFSSTDVADYNSVINNFITISSSNNKLVVKDVNGTATGTVTVTNTMTFNDLFAALSPLGVDGDIQDGRVTFLDNYGGYVDGTFATALGITTTYKTVTSVTTVGTTKTGGAKTYTVTYDATGSNTFKEIGSGGNKTYYIVNGQSGATIKAGTFTESTTIGQFADILGQYGFSASIDGGYFTASSPQGMYVKGTAADALGLTTYTYTQTVHGTATNVISATDTQVVNQTRTLDVASTGLVTVTAKDTIVIDVTKTQTVASTGLVTVNAKQTLTVNISQTLNVASSGYVTVSAKQTVVVDQTRTISTNSSGYATINVTRTINVAQTLNVTTTGAKTITTTIVTKFTVSQNATGTATITIPTTNVTPVTSTPNGSTKLSDAGILTSGSAEIRIRTTNYASSQNYATGDANIGKKVTIYSTDTIDQAIAKINATEESCTNVNWGVADTATGVTKMRMHAEYSTSSGVFSVKVQLLKGSSWVDADTYENSSGGWNSNGYGSCLGIYGADAFSTTSASYDRLSGDNGNYTGAYYSRFSYNVPKITTYQTTTGTRTQTITTGATINRTITTTSTATQTVTITSAGTTTVNVSRTITIAQTVAVNTTGTATINIKQTLTINATQTAAVNTTGLTTVNVTRVYTISATQTATVNTTGYTTVNIKQTRTVTATQTTNVAVTGKTTVNICQTLKITAHQTITVDTTSTRTVTANKSSADKNVYSVAYNMDGNTKLSQVGLGAGTITVVHKGTSSVISLAASDTIDSVIGRLGAYGIEAYVSAAGAMTFKGTTDGYITGATGSAATLGATAAYTTTSATAVLGTNSAGARKTRSVTNYMNSDTTLAQLGWAAGTVTGVEGGQAFTVSVGTNNSIGDLLTALAGYNISGVISSDGKLTLKGSFNGYITGATGGLSTGLGIGQSTVKTTQTVVNGTNSAGARKTRNITKTMNSDTTLAQLGLAAGTVKGIHEGKAFTVSMGTNNSIGDLISALAGYGISGVVSSAGKLTLTGSADGYITEATGGLLNGLGIGVSTVKSTSTVVQGINTAANRKTRTITKTMNSDTTLAQLGLAAGTVKGIHEGKAFTVSMGTNNSIGDLISALAGYGISGVVSSAGKLTLTGSADGYITSATGGLLDGLGIGVSTVKSTKTVVNGINSAANRKTRTITKTMNSDTTLAQLGWAAGTVKGMHEGKAFTVSMGTNNSIGDLISALAGYGISGVVSSAGKLTLTGSADGYITSATGGLLDGLGIGVSTVKSTKTVVNGINSAANRKTRTITKTMNSDTTLAQLGWAAGTVKGMHEGKAFTVSMGTNNSIGDLISALAGYGISGMISSDGKLTLTGSADGYITEATGGLKDNLGIVKSTVKSTKTVVNGINSAADRKTRSITQTMNSDTTLADFGWAAGTVKGYYQGQAFTITMQTNNTIGDLISALAARGIAGTISNTGKLTLTGSADGYITSATGGLLDGLGVGVSTVKSTTTVVNGINSAADRKTRTITNYMDSDTTLAQLGWAAGTVTGYHEGKAFTVSMGTNNSIGDLISALAGYGVSGMISSDGKLTLTGSADGYITAATGGLKDNLGIVKSTVKSTKTVVNGINSAADRKTRSITQTMNSDTTLADFGWAAGSVKGYYQGEAFTISMQTNNSIGDLISALAARGIAGTISNAGKLTLTGSADGYITEATGGLADSLGIVTSTVKSTSTVVNGVTSAADSKSRTIIHTMDADTTFADLGLAAGTAKVNYQGKDYTISMNANNTMNDFMTALAGYGISSVIKDGKMTVQGTTDGFVLSTTGGVKDLGIKTSTLKTTTTTVTGDNGLSTTLIKTTDPIMNRSTLLSDLQDADGNNLGITTGSYYIYQNGVRRTQTITEDMTVNDLMSQVAEYGLIADIAENGEIALNGHGNSYMATSAIGGTKNSNIVEKLFAEWDFTKIYDSNNLSIPTPVVQAITKDTKLDNISSSQEFKEGIITIFKDGIKTNLYVNKEDTVGTFMDELAMHGFNSVINDKGQLIVKTDGNSNLQNYSNSSVSSNVLDILGLNSNNWISTSSYQSKEENVITYHDEYIDAKEDTVLASIKKNSTLESINGNIEMTVDGVKNIVSVNENETVGSLLGKFRDLGLEATISNGQILIQSGYKDIEINEAGTTSALGRSNTSIGLSYFNDLGGYASSDAEVISTTYENKDISVSNWADLNTNLSMLNITSGTFSVYENGQKAVINITSDDTFATLQAKIQNKLNDVKVSFDNGYLTFTSNSGGKVTTGSSTDTSNLSSITGLSATGNKTVSARELYKVNAETSLIGDGLFREDNIYEGTFTIGEEEFTIDSTTTLNDVMNMINSSENSGATAYWDSVGGKLVLNSRSTGSMFVNVEKGTSNFTDVMGLTSTKNGVSRMNIEAQQVGTNAEFTIDGTTYTSNSNTITSDISRIKGVTLQLKSISQDEETASTKEETLSVEKDRETLSNAIEDVLDSYNELMTNVDKSIAAGGDLSDQTTLKMIRNQLRSLMTSSILDANAFKNVDAIGISVEKATGSNISTSGLTTLTFNKDKFYQAYNSDPLAVKSLLIGTDTSKGILTRIEDLVESTLTGVTGYFDTQNNSYMKQIQQINDRISKENRSNSRYQEILESKFSAMDLLISQMQQQYSSFLSS